MDRQMSIAAFFKLLIHLKNRYGFSGMLRLLRDYILAKYYSISFGRSKLRLVRSPVYIRGMKYIKIGREFTSGVGLRLDAFPLDNEICIKIGDGVQVNDYVHIGAVKLVLIGNNVLIASNVFISDHNHGIYKGESNQDSPDTIPLRRKLSYVPVVIEDNVWIGEFVSVLPGVTIGKGSVVGTMSVVTKDIPPYSIAVGSPARVVKEFNFDTKKWEKV